MKKTILILAIMLSVSCKDKAKNIETQRVETLKKEVVKDNVLSVILDIIVEEDDKFELFYVDDSSDGEFNGDKRLATYIKGNNDFQTIAFKLPKDVFPYKLRIDLGENGKKHDSNLEVRSIQFQLNGNSVKLDNKAIDSLFQPNAYLEKIDKGYSRKVIDGKYDPFLYAKPTLITKMEIEL